jgi:hypothetical protein
MTTVSLTIKVNLLPTVMAGIDGALEHFLDTLSDDIVSDTQARAPVRTGQMRDGYHKLRISATEYEVRSDPDLEYPLYVEMGTYKMAAQPHFTPAAEAQVAQAEAKALAAFAQLVR